MPRISFELSLFRSKQDEKISLKIPADMAQALDQLGEVMGMDRSKTVRWCLERILLEAVDQKKIKIPLPDSGAA